MDRVSETSGTGHTTFPWPPADDASAAERLARTWQDSVFRPSAFFSAMPRRASLGGPLLYYLIIGVTAAAIRLFWRLSFAALFAESDSPMLRLLRMGDTGSPLVEFLLTPLVLLLTIGLATVITHFALWIVGGAREGMATTTSVLAYSAGPQLFAVVPVLGTIVASIWSVVLLVIGLREAHGITTARAVAAVLLPLLVIVGLLMLLLVAMLATGASLLLPDLAA